MFRKYIPEYIYGATDGIITTFAIVTGIVASSLSFKFILIIGFASLLADSVSMGAASYLSKSSETKNNSPQTKKPIFCGINTSLAFIVIGSVPLLPYVAGIFSNTIAEYSLIISISLSALAFLIIGFLEGAVSNNSKFKSAIKTLAIGTAAAMIAYGVGSFLSSIN